MGDALLGVVTAPVLKKVLSLAAEELSLAWGLDKTLRKLADKVQMIHALLSDAQSKQSTSEAVQPWLQKLQRVSLDAEDVLDEFGYEVLRQKIENRKRDKVRSFLSSSNPLSFRLKVAHEIKDVISSLEELYAESHQFGLRAVELISSLPHLMEKRMTDPFVEDSEIVGRDDDTSKVIDMLIGLDYERDLPVITIQGMGGQGKTTLAQLVYKKHKVQSHFDKRVWVCVSDDFNVEKMLAEMLQSLAQTNCQLTTTEALVNRLKEELSGKRYLLVLDDVWNENRDEWERMRRCLLEIGGSKGSKVLTTTRSEEVASVMRASGYHRLQVLSEEQSWALFEKCAFAEGGATKTPQLVDIGKRILKRCGGVPLAIKAIGGLLYSQNCESEWSMIERNEMWSVSSGGDRVLSVIKLSYDYLPSLSLKQCFAYCAIFRKDTLLEKDELIQLWMAQGLLNPPKGSQLLMEDIGSIYFNILLRSSLLQDARMDRLKYYKMHDLVHDLSLQVSKDWCFHIEKDLKVETNEIEAMHISIFSKEGGMLKSLNGVFLSKLRTLHSIGFNLLEELFVHFECLSVLIVKYWNLAQELPDAIGKMKRLKFLDISATNIRKLPKSLTKLYYLQTLRVCHLDELPEGFHKLINLRHLYCRHSHVLGSVPKYLAPRIGELRNLQTLLFFKVDKCDGCQIEELEHLDNLRGELSIFCLENVSNRESVLKANLSKKSSIETLKLHWNIREEDCDDTDVMEGLKCHSNLKSLEIYGYQSPRFPSWMMAANNDLLLLRGLMKILLKNWRKCERLPSLGDLPFLEHLEISSLDDVKCIGKEFYGWTNVDRERKSNSSKGAEITLFPALRKPSLSCMIGLVEWSDAIIPTQSSIKAFPHLEEIRINLLVNLIVFPNLGPLPCLRQLQVNDCCALINIPDIHCLHSLDTLSIEHRDKLSTTFCSLNSFVPLKSLDIKCNPSLWPKELSHLTNLRTLTLEADSNELDCFPFPYSISKDTSASEDVQHFVSLTTIELLGYGSPKVTFFCDQIQYLTTLRNLKIWGFNELEALPEWLSNLQCLQNLGLLFCKKLKQLPSSKALQCLTNLQNLTIQGCPLLIERCTKGRGSEWPKIAHIPNLHLYPG